MLDIKFIKENTDLVKKAAKEKHIDIDIDKIIKLDDEIAALKTEHQGYLETKNKISAKIPNTEPDKRSKLIEESKLAGENAKKIEEKMTPLIEEFDALMLWVPNIPMESAPIGESEDDNVVIKTWGEKPNFDFEPKDHYDILIENNWADFERAAKVCGNRSHTLKGVAARLELALHAFMMDKMIEKGFNMITVPSICGKDALIASGLLPKGEDDVYYMEKDDKYLAGTAEVILTSLHTGEILSENDLPILYAGYSPCFRRESGSAGRDVRGLFRVHQFTKTEQFIICKNDKEESAKWHQKLFVNTEELLQALELPYQVVECCTGDMGQGKFRMNDFEVWMPAQNKYRETHSCSTLHDWQARRANLRYRENETGKVKFTHTLNNTGIATPRIISQFLENHQTKDGKIKLPKAIQPYMGGREFL